MDRRTLLAISLSFVLLVVYQTVMTVYYPPEESQETAVTQIEGAATDQSPVAPGSAVPNSANAQMTAAPVAPAVVSITGPTATLHNGFVTGKVSLSGGRLIEVQLMKHKTELGEAGYPIRFVNENPATQFFGESAFVARVPAPSLKTTWTLDGTDHIENQGQIRMFWDNGAGLRFERTFAIEANSYLIHISDRVINNGAENLSLFRFFQYRRIKPELTEDKMMAVADFIGPMGFLNEERHNFDYDELRESQQALERQKGWIGFSDKYFLASAIPANQDSTKTYYFDFQAPSYRVGVSEKLDVMAGGSSTISTRLYVGPKEIKTLKSLNMDLERSIDYGWFHFLAEPLVQLLLFFHKFVGNYGIAIILLTLIVKLLFFPLANKSYRSMNAMRLLQPKIEKLKQKYGDDRQGMNQEMMKLYQDNKVNPLGGCLPVVIQIPVFFALYKVLFLSVEMRHAPFFGWITDLSVMDPYYVLPVLMGASMFIQSKLNPKPADAIQAKVMMFLPVVFTVLFLTFPAGLVLYWLVNNTLSIIQQGYIIKLSAKEQEQA
ncbi:MAG: membrane protein insertase YidC [Magnetococcales bacterium]|nr:membrane protein insertase YidC [Magnetococcales bacterium]